MSDPTTSLIDSLRKEGMKNGVAYNYSDSEFVRKINALTQRVPREHEIVLAFRAFCADPSRGVTPFWFPDRFEKYRAKIAAAVTQDSDHQEFDYLHDPARLPLDEVQRRLEDDKAKQGDTFTSWLSSRPKGAA